MTRRKFVLSAIGGVLAAVATFHSPFLVAAQGTGHDHPTAEQLAKDFRAALGDGHQPVKFATWLSNIWADTVVITHTPPLAHDGPTDGRKLGAGEIAIFTEMQKAIPDYRQENLHVSVDGNVIVFSEEIVGTLDGTVHRVPTHYRFTVEHGRIARVHGTFDTAKLAPFTAVVKKAKLRTPD